MAVTATPVFPQALNLLATRFTSTDTTVAKVIFTPGANGSFLESIIITTQDTVARDIYLLYRSGGVSYQLTRVTVPLSSGDTAAIVPLDLLRNSQVTGLVVDANGNKVLPVLAGDAIWIGLVATMTAGKNMDVLAVGSNL